VNKEGTAMRRGQLMDKLSKKIVSRTVLTLCLIIIVTLACNIQPVKAEPSNVIATCGTCGKGYLENVNGLLVLHVKGSPYDMGYQHGCLLKDYVQGLIYFGIQRMLKMTYPRTYSYDFLVTCAHEMEKYIPQEYIEEMQGLADGASMNYTDVLIDHVIPDIKYYYGSGCNGFAVFGNATKDGHLYFGRSLDDILPAGVPVGLITVCEPENGTAFVNVGFPGQIGAYTGMNKEGITLESNLSPSNDTTLDGTPILFTYRKVLQYSNNLTEATAIICNAARTTGWNILLGDGKNLNAAAVEISDNYCKVFWAGDQAENMPPYYYPIQDAVLRTNQYVDRTLAATQRSPYDPTIISSFPNVPNWSWVRYAALRQWIEGNYGNIDAEMSIELLRTVPIACPGNLQSVVFDSTNLELWVANAANNTPAYEREFIHLSYNDLFPDALTVSSTAGGNVTTPGEGTFTYDEGTVVNLTATPASGYRFVNWTGDVVNIANVKAAKTTITMNDNYLIKANFEKSLFWLIGKLIRRMREWPLIIRIIIGPAVAAIVGTVIFSLRRNRAAKIKNTQN
jgi:hypothetical protein